MESYRCIDSCKTQKMHRCIQGDNYFHIEIIQENSN